MRRRGRPEVYGLGKREEETWTRRNRVCHLSQVNEVDGAVQRCLKLYQLRLRVAVSGMQPKQPEVDGLSLEARKLRRTLADYLGDRIVIRE